MPIVPTSTVNLDKDVNRRIQDCNKRVFKRYETKILEAFKSAWTGWLYGGSGGQRNVSLKAWGSKIEITDTNHIVMRVFNTEDYSSYVHRSGSTTPEWQVIWAKVEAQMIPALIADLQAEIIKTLSAPTSPKKLGGK